MNIRNIRPIKFMQASNKRDKLAYKGACKMQNDIFKKSSNKGCLVFLYNSDGMIYSSFKFPNYKETVNCLLDTDDIEPNFDLIDTDVPVALYLRAMKAEKPDNDVQDKFYQPKKGIIDTQTEIVGTIYDLDDNLKAKIKIQGFDVPIKLDLKNYSDMKVNDKIQAYGVLDCELVDEN